MKITRRDREGTLRVRVRVRTLIPEYTDGRKLNCYAQSVALNATFGELLQGLRRDRAPAVCNKIVVKSPRGEFELCCSDPMGSRVGDYILDHMEEITYYLEGTFQHFL